MSKTLTIAGIKADLENVVVKWSDKETGHTCRVTFTHASRKGNVRFWYREDDNAPFVRIGGTIRPTKEEESAIVYRVMDEVLGDQFTNNVCDLTSDMCEVLRNVEEQTTKGTI